jgi:hypothetical protein
MTTIPMNASRYIGQTSEAPGVTSGFRAGEAFGKSWEKVASGEVTSAQAVSEQIPNTSGNDGLTATITANPVESVLKPKLEFTGQSLAALHQRVDGLANTKTDSGLRTRLVQLETDFKSVDKNIGQTATSGNPMDMLKLQNDIYRIDEELELLSKVVEQMTSGIKTVLQMQI